MRRESLFRKILDAVTGVTGHYNRVFVPVWMEQYEKLERAEKPYSSILTHLMQAVYVSFDGDFCRGYFRRGFKSLDEETVAQVLAIYLAYGLDCFSLTQFPEQLPELYPEFSLDGLWEAAITVLPACAQARSRIDRSREAGGNPQVNVALMEAMRDKKYWTEQMEGTGAEFMAVSLAFHFTFMAFVRNWEEASERSGAEDP